MKGNRKVLRGFVSDMDYSMFEPWEVPSRLTEKDRESLRSAFESCKPKFTSNPPGKILVYGSVGHIPEGSNYFRELWEKGIKNSEKA